MSDAKTTTATIATTAKVVISLARAIVVCVSVTHEQRFQGTVRHAGRGRLPRALLRARPSLDSFRARRAPLLVVVSSMVARGAFPSFRWSKPLGQRGRNSNASLHCYCWARAVSPLG